MDSLSPARILKLVQQLELSRYLSLRAAENGDLEKTYQWAIDPVIRSFSFNNSTISHREHTAWFRSKISDSSCVFLIGSYHDKVIGSIRFDTLQDEMVISYLIDPSFHNQGLGVVLLKKGIEWMYEMGDVSVQRICGYVKKENIASRKAFERLGFKEAHEKDVIKYYKKLR